MGAPTECSYVLGYELIRVTNVALFKTHFWTL